MFHVAEMKGLAARERISRKAPPKSVIATITRAVGAEGAGRTNVKVFRKEYGIVLATNAALKEKNCAPVNINSLAGDDIRFMGFPTE